MGASPDWTAQGELLGKHLGGSTTSYASDSLGRLQSVTLPTGHVVSYVYDGSNRRVGKKVDGTLVQGFLYRDAIKPVVELDGAENIVSRFVYGTSQITPDYVIKGGSTYKIFSDQIGSPRVVVDVSSGSIVERIDYDERGNTLKDTNAGFIPFGFAGGIVDRDTGLIRFGARDYDPSVGRWTEKEPLGFKAASNFYQYAACDPVNFVDFSGLETELLFWEPVGVGTSSFGHVSVRIDDQSYSFSPRGMDLRPFADFAAKNSFRSGHGYILDLSTAEEKALASKLSSYNAQYSAMPNNCTAPIQFGLFGGQYAYLPQGLEQQIVDSGLVIGETRYPASDPALGHGIGLGNELLHNLGFWTFFL